MTVPDKRDYLRSIVYILLYVIVIGGGAFLMIPRFWVIWLVLVVGGMVILVSWHKKQTAYQCPDCDHVYTISFFTDLISPHGIDRNGAWLLLRCPNCKQRNKTKVLKRAE